VIRTFLGKKRLRRQLAKERALKQICSIRKGGGGCGNPDSAINGATRRKLGWGKQKLGTETILIVVKIQLP